MSDLGVIDLTMRKGRTFRFRFTVKDDVTETALPITGSTFAFYAKYALTDDDADAPIIATTGNGKIAALDANNGLGEVTIDAEDTEDLAFRNYQLDADLREITSDGDVVSVATGILAIRAVAIHAIA